MKSIRDLYKIGKGPSSSHTMGPERAAAIFKEENPYADEYAVVLYGSLSKTGVGHGTDRVLRDTLAPTAVHIRFCDDTPDDIRHPNTMDFQAYTDGEPSGSMRVESVGGGDIVIVGREPLEPSDVYPENSFAEIAQFCRWRRISLVEYVELNEGPEIWDFLLDIWKAMRQSIEDGLAASGELPGGLHVQRKAKLLFEQTHERAVPALEELQTVCAYAFAVAEQNADNGTVVTAPTCGSCGVLPAVLLYMQQRYEHSDLTVAHALGVAGLFGNLVKQNASISGAECGCQAEIGTACSMAAAAMATLSNMSLEQTEYAAEIAMEHQLGLTCDPICGLVQIPCIERNAVAAKRAMDAVNLAFFLTGTRTISFDMVVRTMYDTGINISRAFRETSEGGLARLYSRGSKK
ncbi:MAG: L-serine ammonia-lyase, iron-sulfur-dependent, subunit alpha [Oscillospiraceae bacterium]|nr:L-serine ammonia-lyase, iron-sulfur-dependent, subunit alpha [Oscillospiraceae bacterium]